MNTDTDRPVAATPEVIPPLPGGGSWRWEQGAWVLNEPVIETPAAPSPITEE